MKLTKATVHKYKSFLTEQSIDVEPEITRIVGKNESGKSALLEAMAKSFYYDDQDSTFKFDKDLDYPRSELIRVRKDNPAAVTCEYSLSDQELDTIEKSFLPGILKNRVSKSYPLTLKYGQTTRIISVFFC